MKPITRHLNLLLVSFVLTVLLSRPVLAAEEQFGQVSDSWQVIVNGEEAVVERSVQMDAQISPLVRGSGTLQPAAIEAFLESGGAGNATCTVEDGLRWMTITCRYRQPLVEQKVSLPGDTFLYFLLDLPVNTAQGVHINTAGEVTVPGIVAGLPPNQTIRLGNGGFHERDYALSALSTLVELGETRLPPGQVPVSLDTTPVLIPFLPRFDPRPSAWLAMFAALLLSLFILSRLLPARARLPLMPKLWQPDLGRLWLPLRFLVQLLVWFVNWLKKNWPKLLNTAVGGMLALLGLQTLFIAWNLARIFDNLAGTQTLLQELFDNLPLTLPLETLTWSGWPFVVGGLGVALLATGIGLIARREFALLLFVGVLLAGIGGVLFIWPHLLLAPDIFSAQLELVVIVGAFILFGIAGLARGLMHPQFRRYYERIQ